MILIDPRAGSENLPKLFPRDMVLVTDLPAGDILLTSHDGAEFWSVIEFKKINDLLSCIVTGRIAGTQLPDMLAVEGLSDYWLLVEGDIRQGKQGELMVESARGQYYHAHVGNRYFNMSDLWSWETTMVELTPLKIKYVRDRGETVTWVKTQHEWWRRGPENHRSHMVTDKSHSNGDRRGVDLVRASLLRLWAEKLPGIGHDKAIRVEQHFGDAFEMAVAGPDEWTKIEGVGEKMANRIVEAIRGRE